MISLVGTPLRGNKTDGSFPHRRQSQSSVDLLKGPRNLCPAPVRLGKQHLLRTPGAE